MTTFYQVAYLVVALSNILGFAFGKDTTQLNSFFAVLFAYKAFEEICKRNDIERNKPKE